jgi:elongation factor Ts
MTGAGVGDCKGALDEAGGDIDKAIEVLRKKGAIKAAKKSDRATKEGVIAIARQADKIAIAGLACETDFVSLSQDFIDLVGGFSQKLLEIGPEEFKTWAENKIKDELAVKIGENLQLVGGDIYEGKLIGTYLHSNKKIAGIVVLNGGTPELAGDLAMQVVAMSPKYITPEEVDQGEMEKEKEIYRAQLKNEGKQEAMWDKIIAGKLQKYFTDVCLVKQAFIKDDKKSIEKLLAENGNAKIVAFKRYQITGSAENAC